MRPSQSPLGLAALAMFVVGAAASLDCVKEVDHKKEYTSNGKIYKLYCNSEIQPLKPADLIKGVATAEECADHCAADDNCGHGFYAGKNQNCFLRPKPTSIKEKSFSSKVSTLGNTWGWVYDRDVTTSGDPSTGGGSSGGGSSGGGSSGGSGSGGSGSGGSGSGGSGSGGSGSGGSGSGGSGSGGSGSGGPGSGTSTGWSGNQPEYDCAGNKDHKKLFSINGRAFELLCGHANPSTGYKTIPNVHSLRACVEKCALDPACGNAEYHTSTGACELEPDHNPVTNPGYHLWVPKSCPDTPRALSAVANPPQTTDVTCPMSDGHIYEGVDGTWYYIQCCSDSAGAVITGFAQASDHQDCLDKCSMDPKCSSVSFDTAAKDNCKFYGPGIFSTLHKPGFHHHYATSPPTVAPKHFESRRCSTECPEADGQIYAAPTGENFVMSCKKRHGTTYLKATPDRYPSFASCMKACGAVPACLSVDYEPKTQNCYFSTSSKSPTIAAAAFMSAHSAGCSGACAGCEDNSCKDLHSGPLGARKYGCPANHGKPITVNGQDFQVACQHGINSHPWTEITGVSNYEECIEKCAGDSTCGGVNWINPKCYRHPDTNSDGSSAYVSSRADSDAYVKIPGHLYNSLASTP